MPRCVVPPRGGCLHQLSHPEFRLLEALLDLLARMVPAIGNNSSRKAFISSIFNAKVMRSAFPNTRRQELEQILNGAKPDTWEDVGIRYTT